MTAKGRGWVPAQFAALALVWGASFLFIRVALDGLSPVQVVFGRLTCGALVLGAVMVGTRRRWPRGVEVWGHLTVIAVLLCVAPFLLFAWAGQHIDSGLSSIYNATTPLTTLLVSLAVLPDERLTRTRTWGVVIAALGVVVVASPWSLLAQDEGSGWVSLMAQVACLGATTCYGLAFVYSRRFLRGYPYDATTIAASQIGVAALLTAVLMPFAGTTSVELTVPVVASVVVLGAVGTGIAYIWNTRIIQAWGATLASTVTYLTPLVGVTLGVLVLGESLHWNEPVGAALVIVGILTSQGRLRHMTLRAPRLRRVVFYGRRSDTADGPSPKHQGQ